MVCIVTEVAECKLHRAIVKPAAGDVGQATFTSWVTISWTQQSKEPGWLDVLNLIHVTEANGSLLLSPTGAGSLQLLKMTFWVIWCLMRPQKPAWPFCASPAKPSLVLLPEQKLVLILTEALTKTYCCMILQRQGFLVITLALWYYPVCKAIGTSLPVRVHIHKPCASESPSSSTKVQLWIQPSSSTLKIMVAESTSLSSGLPLCQVQQKSVSV